MKGFTLIETITTIAILAVIAGMLIPVMREGIDAWIFIKDRNEVMAQGRLCLDRMIAEIREAESLTDLTGGCTPTCLGRTIAFRNSDGNSLFFRSPGNTKMVRDFSCSWDDDSSLLLCNVQPGGAIFAYFDKDGNSTSTPANVNSIKIRLKLKDKAGRDLVLESRVSPPNLRR